MNSPFLNAEQPKICSKNTLTFKTQNMETPNHNPDIIFNEDIYTINWSDVENADIDYENYLEDIENFFKEDFENDVIEEEIF